MLEKDPQLVCRKGGRHEGLRIQYFCMEDCCLLDRLLCKSCVNDTHRRHKVGIIDKLIAPLNRLSMNAFNEHASSDFNFISERCRIICQEWGKLNELLLENMRRLESGIIFQLTTLMNTFSEAELDRTYQLFGRSDSDLGLINSQIVAIKFLSGGDFQDVQILKKYADMSSEKVRKILAKTTKKIEVLLSKMQEYVQDCDFSHFEAYKDKESHPDRQLQPSQKSESENTEEDTVLSQKDERRKDIRKDERRSAFQKVKE